MNIALIYGGRSGEHEISLLSASSIARGFSKEDKVFLIAITKKGKWYLQDDSELKRILSDEKAIFEITEKEENLVNVIPGGKKKCIYCRRKIT